MVHHPPSRTLPTPVSRKGPDRRGGWGCAESHRPRPPSPGRRPGECPRNSVLLCVGSCPGDRRFWPLYTACPAMTALPPQSGNLCGDPASCSVSLRSRELERPHGRAGPASPSARCPWARSPWVPGPVSPDCWLQGRLGPLGIGVSPEPGPCAPRVCLSPHTHTHAQGTVTLVNATGPLGKGWSKVTGDKVTSGHFPPYPGVLSPSTGSVAVNKIQSRS